MIILCIGQAGCQIGNSIINLIDNGCYPVDNRKDERYFPAIFVDIDSKVIHKLRTCNVINKNVKDVNVICGYQTKFKPLFSKDDRFVNKILLHVRDEIIKQNNLCGKYTIFLTINNYSSYILRAIVARICLFRIQEKLFWLEVSKNEEQTGVARWFYLFPRLFVPIRKAEMAFYKAEVPPFKYIRQDTALRM